MKILVDCFKLVKGSGKSIGIYNLALNLVRNLVRYQSISEDDMIKNAELVLVGNKFNQNDFEIPGVRFINITNYNPLNKIHCIIWELFAVSLFCKRLEADMVLYPRGYCALTHPIKDIVIIHDFIPFYYHEHYPNVFNKVENTYIMNRLRASAKSCHKIITISEASKKEILKYCRIAEDKILVIPNGLNEIKMDEKKDDGEYRAPYICAMTSNLPHKNAAGIFQVYQNYCSIAEKPLDMVVIGVDDYAGIELSENIKKKITLYKFIEKDIDVHRIISGSSIFLFLSLIEGFGFPPIEAMQLKVPVVCSNLSSLPEVTGDAALLVDPRNPLETAEAIHSLLLDPKGQKELIEKGSVNIKRFCWEDIAGRYWDMFVNL